MLVEVVEVRGQRAVVQAPAHLTLRTTYDLRSQRERIESWTMPGTSPGPGKEAGPIVRLFRRQKAPS